MIKILYVTSSLNKGGLEVELMNLYERIDRSVFSVDFMVSDENKQFYEDCILAKGDNVFHVSGKGYTPHKLLKNLSQTKKVLTENRYDIIHIHIHMSNSLKYFDAKIAKKMGVKVVIYHSHTSSCSGLRKILHILNRKKLRKYCDYFLACSKVAGEFMFGKNESFILQENAINIEQYKFNLNTRELLREHFKCKSCFVVGHVGRMHPVKNHPFLIKALKNLMIKRPESRLCLVWSGKKATKSKK